MHLLLKFLMCLRFPSVKTRLVLRGRTHLQTVVVRLHRTCI